MKYLKLNRAFFLSIFLTSSCHQQPKHFLEIENTKTYLDSLVDQLSKKSWQEKDFYQARSITDIEDTFLIQRKISNGALNDTNKIIHLILQPYEFRLCNFSLETQDSIIFHSPIDIHDSYFNDFSNNTQFDSLIIFHDNHYTQPLEFYYDKFKNNLTFFINKKIREVNDGYDYDYDKIIYNESELHSPSFYNCIFIKGVSFNDLVLSLNYNKTITGSIFKTDLKFENCRFIEKLDLSYCIFDSCTLVLKQTNLPDTLDLSNMQLSTTMNLNGALPTYTGRKCEINLLNTDIDKIQFQYQDFHLFIPDSINENYTSRDLINHTYEALLTDFKKNGYEESYVKLDIEYKDWQSQHDFGMWISNWWWKYAYEKWRILIWTIVILLIFSFFNVFMYETLFATYSIKQLDKKSFKFSKSSFIKVLETYWLSIMYTGFIFFKFSIDFDKIEIKRLGILMLIFVEYSVGLLCTGYLLNWVLSK